MSSESATGNVVEMKTTNAPATAPETETQSAPSAKRGGSRRIMLMAAVPVLLAAIGGYMWLTGGRYVSTDNAYVEQDRVTITSSVSGRIVDVAVKENQAVKAGDLLFRIDPEPYRIALDGAEAALASARLQVEELRANYEQAISAAQATRDDLTFKQKAFDRAKGLLAKGVSSQAAFDTAENDLHAAQQTLSQAEQKIQAALAALGGNPAIETEKHPLVLSALAKRDQARLDLANTEVRSPANGIVSQTDRLRIGQYVTNPVSNPTALLALMETDELWVEANFKETDLTRMVPGEKATVSFDAFPGKSFEGNVESIGAGTGATFSVLPAQNATGNWVKVVQRVPVRIRITGDTSSVALRAGLSADVEVELGSAPTQTGGLLTSPAAAATK